MADFPNSNLEALALLYTKSQNLVGKTPEEVMMIYFEAHKAMLKKYNAEITAKWYKE